ncbi:MAG TPA: hypothetical protein VFJ97_16930 [Dermatophilaceae bacterium]|nr:hypothetical protein [Dermatophilaceae bacterium]
MLWLLVWLAVSVITVVLLAAAMGLRDRQRPAALNQTPQSRAVHLVSVRGSRPAA